MDRYRGKHNQKRWLEGRLRDVIGGSEEEILNFAAEIKKGSGLGRLALDLLEEDLSEAESIGLGLLLSQFPAVVRAIRNRAVNLPLAGAFTLLQVARALDLKVDEALSELYASRRADEDEGPRCALWLYEAGHEGAVDAILEQFSISMEQALEMAYVLRYWFDEHPEVEDEFHQSDDPRLRFIHTKFLEAMEFFAEDEEDEDRLVFFPMDSIAAPRGLQRRFTWEVANGLANRILRLKEEREIPFLPLPALDGFVRQVIPLIYRLIREDKVAELLDRSDEPAERMLESEPDIHVHTDLYVIYRQALLEIYEEDSVYRIDVFVWRLTVLLRGLLVSVGVDVPDEEGRDRFAIKLALEVEGILEDIFSRDPEALKRVMSWRGDPASFLPLGPI